MIIRFKIAETLARAVRQDLARPHKFAHERVGFISAGLSAAGHDLMILARAYRPVADEDYLNHPSVGAMMGSEAIRKALQWSLQAGHAMFHVHTHGGRSIPMFSGVDIRENAKFVPDFFKVTPQCAHGALVLSDNGARGQIWLQRKTDPLPIDAFSEIGSSISRWSPQ
jgi:hypothetical protein